MRFSAITPPTSQNGRATENRTLIYSVKGNYPKPLDDDSVKMVAPVGLEPTTKSLKGFCSNQLSYKAIENCFKELLLTTLLSYHIIL